MKSNKTSSTAVVSVQDHFRKKVQRLPIEEQRRSVSSFSRTLDRPQRKYSVIRVITLEVGVLDKWRVPGVEDMIVESPFL